MLDLSQPPRRLTISSQTVELLLDLVAIKLDAMEIEDRDDRTIRTLQRARDELRLIEAAARPAPERRGPGRPRREHHAAV
ncbi:MAG TPA: hypothetical protein VN802_17760 [Stellaceae bacterium]|nr:hypothetical protein [Stellaceae bacterium]